IEELRREMWIVVRIALQHMGPLAPHLFRLLLAGLNRGSQIRSEVAELGVRRKHHSITGSLHAQTVIDVGKLSAEGLPEAADFVEHRPARHHAGATDRRIIPDTDRARYDDAPGGVRRSRR